MAALPDDLTDKTALIKKIMADVGIPRSDFSIGKTTVRYFPID